MLPVICSLFFSSFFCAALFSAESTKTPLTCFKKIPVNDDVQQALKDAYKRVRKVDASYQCPLCCQLYKAGQYVHDHIRRVHFDMRPFQCLKCKKCFRGKSDVQLHIKRIHMKDLKCIFCGRPFTNFYLREKHELSCVMSDQGLICDVCGVSCTNRHRLWQHRKLRHAEVKFASCRRCGKKFYKDDTRKQHERGCGFSTLKRMEKRKNIDGENDHVHQLSELMSLGILPPPAFNRNDLESNLFEVTPTD